MYAGVAGALLVFAGIWRATEYLMSGRTRGAMRLVPVGVIYLVLGCLIVGLIGGTVVFWIAVVVTAIGMAGAYLSRDKTDIRGWVVWTLVLIDIVILLCLGMALLR